MNKKLIFLTAAAVLSAVFFLPLFGCAKPTSPQSDLPPSQNENVFLPEPQKDPGECLAQTFFIGDSNTAHLAHPGYTAISGLISPEHIWTGSANTLMLDINMSVSDPETKKSKAITDMAKEKKPEFLVITLGYNGFSSPVSDPARKASLDRLFLAAYDALISDILRGSPNTRIIVQSIFPVTHGTEISDPNSVNLRIDELNSVLKNLAKSRGVKYLDTQSVLRDPDTNCLRDEYSKCGNFYHVDGYHLSDTGLLAVLNYIKENAYK